MSRRRIEGGARGYLLILLALVVPAGCGPAGGPVVVRESAWSPAAGIEGVRVETSHYDLKVAATDPVLRAVLPTFLETTFASYRSLLPPPPGRPEKLEVYLFETREQWAGFPRRFVPQRAEVYLHIKAGGYVDAATATAVVWDLGRDTTLTLLAHEGFHQYLAKFFPEPVAAWINEGLATQWEAFDLKGGRPIFTPRLNYHRRNSLREALSEPTGWTPVRQLLAMHAGEAVVQTGQATRGYYAQVWALVLFLREGDHREYRRGFDRLLADVGTERMRISVRAYQAGTPGRGPAGYSEMIFRHYITEEMETFEARYRSFCEKLVR